MEIDKKRGRMIWIVFLSYAILTLIGALTHEMWFDETQAWTIVRDNDLAGIMEILRSEGHPPLWYMILLPLTRMGLSCEVLPLISWFFSVASAALFLWRAPFGVGLKAAYVFSCGSLFFCSVISRVYCLIPFLLALIAIVYPKRRKHPILFGLLIGLLANTHVCFCGLVGIFGIYLLIELFREWRGAPPRENLGKLVGLGVAGVGVLLLVIPLLSSVSLNNSATEIAAGMTVGKGISRLLLSLDDAMYLCVTGSVYPETQFLHPIASVAAIAVVLFLIVFRRWRRWLTAALVFFAFYLFINSIVWWNNPSRTGVMLSVFIFLLWLAFEEGGERTATIRLPTGESDLGKGSTQKLGALLEKLGRSPRETCTRLVTAVFIVTIPIGAFYLISDYFGVFAAAKPTAEYIRENFEPGTVFVTPDDTFSNMAAYLPDYLFYSLNSGRFYTVTDHAESDPIPPEKVKSDLAGYKNVYYLSSAGYDPYGLNTDPNAFFTVAVDFLYHRNHYYYSIADYPRD
ncbi:MAG: hypothetical protein NC084_11190 [Bacteroides sp.]|nr:hypothetical protein [Eubacterium sp.]MCM1419494.1 hypothetical protein [Roseburia sp.]MCM1463255.1 hypothetical protein [Bacteroides sp.]